VVDAIDRPASGTVGGRKDTGVRFGQCTARATARGPVRPEDHPVEAPAGYDLFVVVDSPAEGKTRRLAGEDVPDGASSAFYPAGDRILPEHRELPTVRAELRDGVYVPKR
jgi:hypothetical protein